MNEKTPYNCTQLSPEICFQKHVFHRDQFAHYLRWSFVLRNIELKNPPARVLDVGCGSGNLFETLWRNMVRVDYTGLDVRKRTIANNIEKFKSSSLHPQFFCHDITTPLPVQGEFDYVCSFEVIEHIGRANAPLYLGHMRNVMTEKTLLYISTPNYDPAVGAAKNHIQNDVVQEFTHIEMKRLLLDAGFEISMKYGTFASKKDIYPLLNVEQKNLYDQLSAYYDTNVMSIMFAPLFPEQGRNCLWICKKISHKNI